MNVNWQLFRFPFDDERWKSKAAVGGLLGLLAVIIWPLYLPLMGFGMRVMRQTVRGESPSLPEWDNWGELFGDGLRFFVVSLVYGLPALLLMCCAMVFWLLALVPMIGAAAAEGAEAPGLVVFGVGGMIAAYGVGMLLMGVGTILSLFLSFLGLVAQTRWVALDSLSSAFEFGEVWRLTRAGFNNYLLAFAVWYGGIFLVSMLASVLMYTIVLACLYPFALGLMMIYSTVLMGALYGMAYYHTHADMPAAE